MSEPEPSGPEPGVTSEKRRFHWHVYLTHFPISLFGAAFGFQILHLFMAPACFELATNVALIGGTATLLPAIISGWYSWKTQYHGASSSIFKRKIVTGFSLVLLSFPLVIWRVVALGVFQEARQSPAHWVYLAGNTLLILGAVVEGYYGGRLNHR